MASVALVSILGLDRVGLVAAIADCLFTAGVNLRDTTFAVLGKGAEFTSVCELPDGVSAEALLDDLELVPELEGAQVRVVPYGFDAQPGPMGRITHRIEVSGERRDEHPRAYTRLFVKHIVRGQGLSEQAVAQAIELSDQNYCSVAATLRGTAQIVTSYEIIEESNADAVV